MKRVLSVIAVMAAMSSMAVSAYAQTGGTGGTGTGGGYTGGGTGTGTGGTGGTGGGSATTNWKALAAGALESPPNPSPGSAVVTIDVSGQQLFVDDSFRDLTGSTTDSHIHCCTSAAFTGVAPIAVPFTDFPTGVRAGTYTHAIPLGTDASYDPAFLSSHGGTASAASSALMDAIAANEAYVNIHTSAFPNGEVRGWLVSAPVPEPGEWAMLAGGLVGLAGVARMKRRG